MTTTRWAARVAVVVLGAVGATVFARLPEVPGNVEQAADEAPADTTASDRVPESVSVWQVDPRPEVAGPWVVYTVGAVSCCDEQGQPFGPVPTVTCVPALELEAGLPERELTFWQRPVPGETYEQDDPCPEP